MENNKEIEKDGENTTAASADNEAMVIGNEGEVDKENKAGGEEKELIDDSGNRSMDVEDERPVEGKDEVLGSSRNESMEVENENPVEAKNEDLVSSQKKSMDVESERTVEEKDEECPRKENEKGKETVDAEPNKNGEFNGNKSVTDVANHSVEEKGSVQTHPANESASAGDLVPKNQLKHSVVAGEKDEKSKELSNGVGKQLPVQDGERKVESSNGLTTERLFVKNGAKEEDLKNEVEKAKFEDPKKRVTGGQSVVYDGTKGQPATQVKEALKPEPDTRREADVKTPTKSFLYETDADGYESGTEEEQALFVKELETFHRERGLDFKPPKFYQEKLNLLKLWRSVIKLGGYEQVTSCKLWRQVGESFKPPKTCTTVSWTFRGFYEKSLLEYEKHKILSGELPEIDASLPGSMSAGTQAGLSQGSGSGRARRDAAARAMQGWHSMRLLSNGEVGDPIIKDKNPISLGKREKQLKSIGLLKRRKESPIEHAKIGHLKPSKPQSDSMVVDIGPPADWVKINVQRTKDCFEVYALVPGLLREEVRVQSDPAGRLVISGQPEQLDNPWGVTPFKKVVTLPSRIDPHQTSAVVTLHGQLFVRVPFEQSDA